MPGGYPIALDACNCQSIAVSTSVAGGMTALAPATAANTKGAYVTLSASLPQDCAWLEIDGFAISTSTGVTQENWAFDLAIGSSGSEQVIVNNLVLSCSTVSTGNTFTIGIPLHIAAGTRLSARSMTNVGTVSGVTPTNGIAIRTYDGSYTQLEGFGSVDAVGFNAAATHGSSALPSTATAFVKGAYTQLTAASTADYAGFFVMFDSLGAAPNGNIFDVDVAIGGAGVEQVIAANLNYRNTTNVGSVVSPYKPIAIPNGSRIAVRASANVANVTAVGVTVYGVRK